MTNAQKHKSFTTSHTSKEILKLRYSVNYRTSTLLLLSVVAKKAYNIFMYTFIQNV